MSFEIISINRPNNSERYKKYSANVEWIENKINLVKSRHGVESAEMQSFNHNLLPSSEIPMVLNDEVYADYKRILETTNQNGFEYNFLWLGNKKELNGREYLSIEKAVVIPDSETQCRSECAPVSKILIFGNFSEYDNYDVVIDGHSHPVQNPSYRDFDKLPAVLLLVVNC